MDEEQIITLFFARSEQAIEALDAKYGKLFHSLSYHIVNDRQDADECVNDAYLTPLLCRKSRSVFQTERVPRKRWRQGSSPASLRAFWIRCPQRTA